MPTKNLCATVFLCALSALVCSVTSGQGAGTWNERRTNSSSVPQISTAWANTQAHLILMGSMSAPTQPPFTVPTLPQCQPMPQCQPSPQMQQVYEITAAANALAVAGRLDLQGKWLGFSNDPNNAGQCATGVQAVYAMAGYSLGHSSTWRRGDRVVGNAIPAGSAIAYFPNGKQYKGGHTAIYAYPTNRGIVVYDQFKTGKGHAWGTREIRRDGQGKNDADSYHVIKR